MWASLSITVTSSDLRGLTTTPMSGSSLLTSGLLSGKDCNFGLSDKRQHTSLLAMCQQ